MEPGQGKRNNYAKYIQKYNLKTQFFKYNLINR